MLNVSARIFRALCNKASLLGTMRRVKFRFVVFSLTSLILFLTVAVIFFSQLRLTINLAATQRSTDEFIATEEQHYALYVDDSSEQLIIDLELLKKELSLTQRSLINSALHFHRIGKHIELVHGIIQSIQSFGRRAVSQDVRPLAGNSTPGESSPKKEVCPEKFMGKDHFYGYPFFRKGFERVNCAEFVPINQLVTILTILPKELSPEEQYQVLQGITKHYPNINISLASKEKLSVDVVTKLKLNIKSILSKDLTHGETWSKLLQEVNTPYVVFAPDITYFTDDVNLERLVRVLSENRDTIIAGGSHKNQRGEWDKGCLQVVFRNWTAYFVDGYYHSFSDCIVCDVLPGPFMAKTKRLKELGIDENLPFGVRQDLFWRLKLKHPEKVVVSCPDVMFDTYEREVPDERYVALAQKWDVKKWVESNGRVRWYGCRRAYSHTSKRSCTRPGHREKGMAIPPCDLENLADAVKFIMKVCEEAGLYCELEDGTILGAVKFRKVLPWEKDADIRFLSENYTAILELRPRFEAAGFRFNDVDGTECCTDGRETGGKIFILRNYWRIELHGISTLESEILVASGQRPTKVMFAGQWVTAMRNPGLFSRNRYGPNIFRHAQHWIDRSFEGPWGRYHPGVFSNCPFPGHSGCLDQFPADGSLQFSDDPLI